MLFSIFNDSPGKAKWELVEGEKNIYCQLSHECMCGNCIFYHFGTTDPALDPWHVHYSEGVKIGLWRGRKVLLLYVKHWYTYTNVWFICGIQISWDGVANREKRLKILWVVEGDNELKVEKQPCIRVIGGNIVDWIFSINYPFSPPKMDMMKLICLLFFRLLLEYFHT